MQRWHRLAAQVPIFGPIGNIVGAPFQPLWLNNMLGGSIFRDHADLYNRGDGWKGLTTACCETPPQHSLFPLVAFPALVSTKKTACADGRSSSAATCEYRSGEELKSLTDLYLAVVPFVLFGSRLRFGLYLSIGLLRYSTAHTTLVISFCRRDSTSDQYVFLKHTVGSAPLDAGQGRGHSRVQCTGSRS